MQVKFDQRLKDEGRDMDGKPNRKQNMVLMNMEILPPKTMK